MPRPRIHDPERLLDVAERLIADVGPEEVTVRGLAVAAGVPNSTIYHSFGSLPALIGRAWLRGAGYFLDVQTQLVEQALAGGGPLAASDGGVGLPAPAGVAGGADLTAAAEAVGAAALPLVGGVVGAAGLPVVGGAVSAADSPAVAAVVAAADTSAVVAELRPEAARLMLTVSPDRILGPQLPEDVLEDLHALDKRLVRLLVRLARELWQRGDGAAVEVITTCVVDLPTALLKRDLAAYGAAGPETRRRLAAAVRAVLALPPPDRPRRASTG
ncbi:TetR/AcrR family transcriptional regulator [Amycolatopsis sp. NBC_01480]|uniref:TetR/AcrR family transcriptional regulator n=1 Tax=Amycolatopsis sp. NBC_01480 TaxID=2903562 RepID=UPI002E2CA9B0|nr:helix-turn-helix domain-containing protein [Amycolatopsis sp. NBC_01480]